jgi:pyruvate decarboxylase
MPFQQIYVGSISHPEIKEKVESAKLVLSIGSLKSDFNTGNFTYRTSCANTVEVTWIQLIACQTRHLSYISSTQTTHGCNTGSTLD